MPRKLSSSAQPGLVEISFARAVAGAQIEQFAAFIQHHAAKPSCASISAQASRVMTVQGLVQVQGGIDGLADADEGFQQPRF